MSIYHVVPIYKEIEKFNPKSEHHWTEQGKIIGYEVTGGIWCRTNHLTIKKAKEEIELREFLDEKYGRNKNET